MSYTITILLVGALAALIRLISVRDTLSILIILIQIAGIITGFISNRTIGYYIFFTAILLALIYPFIKKEKIQTNKNWIWLFLIPILIAFIFEILNLPGYGIIRLTMLIPLAFFIYAGINHGKYKYEIGFMILFAADAMIKLLGYFL